MKVTSDQEIPPSEHEDDQVSSEDPSSNGGFFGPEGELKVSLLIHITLPAAYLNITKQFQEIMALLQIANTGPTDLGRVGDETLIPQRRLSRSSPGRKTCENDVEGLLGYLLTLPVKSVKHR